MSDRRPDVSVILLTYNGQHYLSEVLASIFAQRTRLSYEVIAVDSGSSDRTLEILSNHPVRVIQIPNQEFGHGRTRNLAAQNAYGRYFVFITQDATPADPTWLENLVRPVAEDSRVAGVYSRQVARPECNPFESRDIAMGAGPLSILKMVDFQNCLQVATYKSNLSRFIAFSNVSSCIRSDVLEKLPFSERILMMEDQEWCKRAIESGYRILYEAASVVYHSHDHRLKMIYQRHFDYGRSMREFAPTPTTLRSVLLYAALEIAGDILFILRRRMDALSACTWILKSPIVRFSMCYGIYRGSRWNSEAKAANAEVFSNRTDPNTQL